MKRVCLFISVAVVLSVAQVSYATLEHDLIITDEAFSADEVVIDTEWLVNPDIPVEIQSIKFEITTETTFTFSFDSSVNPVLGDFYAKAGSNPLDQALHFWI